MAKVIAPKRVLHVFMNLNLGGAESRIMDLFRTQEADILVNDFVIMTNEHCYFTDEVLGRGGKIHIIDSPRNGLVKNLWQLYKLLRKAPKYSAIHAHTSYFSGMCVFVAFLAGIPARITHARNTTTGANNLATRIMFIVGRILTKLFATRCFAISSEAGKFLYGNKSSRPRYEVIPNAFDFRNVRHRSEVCEQEKVDFLIDSSMLNIVCVGRFYTVKNHIFLLRLMQLFVNKKNNVCLHLIGDGELKESLQGKVSEWQLDKYVKFWGKRADVPQLLALFDVMVMPSLNEGLGVAALEAQAAGLPCLLSEGIPKEADIGCGLCQYLNLDARKDDWIEAIQKQSKLPLVNKEIIDQQFEQRGYSLSSTRQRYLDAYLNYEKN